MTKKYQVRFWPTIVEAENEDEAFEKAKERCFNGEPNCEIESVEKIKEKKQIFQKEEK